MRRPGTLPLFFLAACLAAAAADSRMNLPQARQVFQLDGAARTAARNHFSKPQAAGELPAELQDALLQSLPADFRNDCTDLMDSWGGEQLRGTGVWSMSLLDREGVRAWLAFRCGSRLTGEDMARYHDERLALMRLDAGTLEFLPLGAGADEFEGVYEFSSAQPLALKNAAGVGFHVKIDNNPCCDGPEYRSQKRFVVFADTPKGVVESLSVITARDDSSHSDDPEVDTETSYRADLTFERGANQLVTAASAAFHETHTDITWESGQANRHIASRKSGSLRYQWNPATFKFEEVR